MIWHVAAGMAVGGFLGWWGGLWWGFKNDHSDLPLYAAVTAPIGAAVGVAVGGLIGAAL